MQALLKSWSGSGQSAMSSSPSSSSTAAFELQRNLEALGLPTSRPPSPTASPLGVEPPALEDGRPATPAAVTIPELTLKDDFEVKVFPNPSAFLEAMRPAGRNWRLNPLLGPAATLFRQERFAGAPARSGSPEQEKLDIRIWIGVYDQGRLSIVLSKIGRGPVVLASPMDAEEINQTRLIRQLSLIAAKLRQLLPDALSTPGGTTTDDKSTPLTNVPSVLGPAVLARPFASLWLDISPSAGPNDAPTLSGEAAAKPLRSWGYSLAQLPRRRGVAAVSLSDHISVRLATGDEVHLLAPMLQEWSNSTPTPLDRHAARRMVQSAIDHDHLWIYYIESACSPTISLIAGFCLIGSDTATSASIVALYTSETYRNRGVAEALLRSACRAIFDQQSKTSIVALIPDPTVARRTSPGSSFEQLPPTAVKLFARVGFRLLDKEEYPFCGIYDGVEEHEGADEVQTAPFVHRASSTSQSLVPNSPSSSTDDDDDMPCTPQAPEGYAMRRSTERWSELQFAGTQKGTSVWAPSP